MRKHLTRRWFRRIAAAALAIVAVATTTGVSACSSITSAGSTTSPTTGQHVAAGDFSTAMKAPGTIVLDVRTPAEYASGHLPAGQNIDIEASDFATRIAALDKAASTYAVYCHIGNRSGTALEQMSAAGFTHVYDLAGGIGAWQEMGGPMATGGR